MDSGNLRAHLFGEIGNDNEREAHMAFKSVSTVCARFVAFPMLVAFIFAFVIPQAGLAQNDPLVGIWKFNAAKSKGYMQGSQIRIIQPSGQGLIQVISSVNDKGHNLTIYTLICDGQPHPIVSFLSDADANTC